MSNDDELKKQQELEKKIQEQARQEREEQIRIDEELRRIREQQKKEKDIQDDISKGKPTGERPDKDD